VSVRVNCLCLSLMEGIEGEAAEKSGAHVTGEQQGQERGRSTPRVGRNPPTRGID
jgi:hypothetical protein